MNDSPQPEDDPIVLGVFVMKSRRWYGFDPSVGVCRRLIRWARNTYEDERKGGCSRVESARRVWRQRQWAISDR